MNAHSQLINVPTSINRFSSLFRSILQPFRIYWKFCALFLLAGCTVAGPKLDRPFFPKAYQIGSISRTEVIHIPPSIHFVKLNHQDNLNRRVLSLWKNSAFQDAFHRVQPLSIIYREDIANLASFLDRLFTIYLVAFDSTEPVSSRQLRQLVKNRFECDPLTNMEIRFLMNSGLSTLFSKKPLTMLLISSHELTLQAGAKPVYPQVFSSYLRKQHKLPPLKGLEDINLFATKKGNKVYSTSMNGFIVCNRSANNHQSNPIGPP